MDKIIQIRIKKLKNEIKPLKGIKGVDRDVLRQNNKLNEYKISQLKTRNDALDEIKDICKTTDFGEIDKYLKKQIKAKCTYKKLYYQAKGYKDKYKQLKAKLDKDKPSTDPSNPTPHLTMDLGNHNNTNSPDKTNVQSDHNPQDNQDN